MKSNLLLFVLLLFLSNLFGAYSKSQATSLVLNTLLVNDIDSVQVFLKDASMSKPDTLFINHGGLLQLPFDDNWVFFVDDLPMAMWCHDCRYIFVSAENGDYEIHKSNSYPSPIYQDFNCISAPDVPTTTNPPTPPPPGTPHPNEYQQNQHLWAIIIMGDQLEIPGPWNDNTAFWNSTALFYNALVGWGFPEDNIIVHYALGIGPGGETSFSNTSNDNDIDEPATPQAIMSTFSNLQSILTPNDVLVVYLMGHGGPSDTGVYLVLPEFSSLSNNTLTQETHSLNCASIFYCINCCYSGGFIDDLVNDQEATCQNRAIHTQCGNEWSYAEEWMTGRYYGGFASEFTEFPLYWNVALRGVYPRLVADTTYQYFKAFPDQMSYNIGTFPFNSFSFLGWNNHDPIYPCNHNYSDYHPDLVNGNHDGILQLREIFHYADDMNSWTMNGYCNPCYPNETQREQPIENYSSDILRKYLTIRGLAGMLQHLDSPITLSGNYVIGDILIADNNTTLNIASNSIITILNGSTIEIKEGSTLSIGDSVSIYCEGTSPSILVQGSVYIGNNVTFEGNVGGHEIGLKLLNATNTTISQAHFQSCDLVSVNTNLDMDHTTFDGSNVEFNNYNLTVYSCDFENSCLHAYVWLAPYRDNSVSITNSDFRHFEGCALNVESYPICEIVGNSFFDNGAGLKPVICLYECGIDSPCWIHDNTIHDNLYSAIELYHSYAKFDQSNVLENNYDGFVALRKSTWGAAGLGHEPFQQFTNNENHELYMDYDSAPVPYEHQIFTHRNHHTAYIYCPEVPNGHQIDISHNAWDEEFDPDRDLYPSRHDYIYLPYWRPGKNAEQDSLCRILFDSAMLDIENELYSSAESKFEELIVTYPDEIYALTAMKEIFHVHYLMEADFAELQTYYQGFLDSENIPLSKLADYLANLCNIQLEDYQPAITWFENQIDNPDVISDSLYATIDLSYLCLNIQDKSGYIFEYPKLIPESREAFIAERYEILHSLMHDTESYGTAPIPNKLTMSNYPNPFNPSTTIRFGLPHETMCKIEIYNIRGQRVKTLMNEMRPAGYQSVLWNGADQTGKSVSSGVYFYRLEAAGKCITHKMLLLK
jgi:hypothetical protein